MFFNENNYDYNKLKIDLDAFRGFCICDISNIGKSVLGRDIPLIKIGKGRKNVCFIGAHHSLEWISSNLLMKFSYNILNAYENQKRYLTFNIKELLDNVTLHIIPMLNPDGTDFVLHPKKHALYVKKITGINYGNSLSSIWQANARGVDLNHNYDAGFYIAKKLEKTYGVSGPCHSRFGGDRPESEPETKAICNYIRNIDFSLLITYHSQGEVIYFEYANIVPKNALTLGKILSKTTGYTLDKTTGISSFGGCKDWFIKEFKKPAYTVELGMGKNPLPFSQFEKIYNDNAPSMILMPLLV